MANEWAIFGADLHLELRGPRLRAGLMDALREAVRSGRLAAGTRLPSSRSLAADLGMARNTVADAYAELVAEGWLTARQGSGTRVARRAEPRRAEPRRAGSRTASPRPTGLAGAAVPAGTPRPVPPAGLAPPRASAPAHNLKAGTPDLASFPRAEWLKAYRRALTAAPNEAFGYGDPRGRIELRTVLAEYLARARGVHARPERIVICAGFVHGLMLMGQVLRARGVRDVAVESYGLGLHAGLLTGAGLGTPALPFDGRGTRVEALADGDAGAVLMTAAHQFPLGGALPPDRRAAVVDWARTSGGLVLEDDYDGEFRYDRQPVGALQGLDPDRVVYFGTASKSLAPGLRLAWMVLPDGLAGEVVAAKGAVDWVCGAPDQLAFAEFLASGAYDRHVRAMRLRYRRRRDQLVAAVAAHSPETRVSGIAAGLHAVLALPPGTEQEVLRAAAWHGLAVQGVNQFRRPGVPATLDGLVVGYATPTDSAWQGALQSLCRVLPQG
ncbi:MULTISPECIES: PLP-dependent aminotransferase family protein [unclassified Streptomyces]|uniref:MocR-like pyridoxine biosynthesis transcription factor PdxR n=1 Tax=unclassified Streptomyces TaxID=2593676 RepID=UPI0006FD2152|nr:MULTISPECIES: PLP-dependent aminotransferase family protein [unclassified Streptomyces]KQX59060.1 GntR family transcriptional regulator [Streptomyces sp. Root1304]KRB00322.1 GntR family transcriptional regulator [Streptomyces sp. Root66D1]